MKRLFITVLYCLTLFISFAQTADFTIPATVRVNDPVNITNTSSGATSYYWNFCVGNIQAPPAAVNMGNPGGMDGPVFMDYAYDNNNYYGFVVNHYNGNLVRLDFGSSLLNTPASVSLGNFGGIIPAVNGGEGIQIVQNEGNWYAIIVGGLTTSPYPPRVLKIDFGPSLNNPAPVATSWGNIGNMEQPIDLHVFKEGVNWYGFTVNAVNNTITRFNFTNSFNNTPTAINLGNLGNLNYPTGIYAIDDNGFWRVFIVNGLGSSGGSLTRLDFGSSLLNAPAAVNLGNPGNQLQQPRDLTIMKFCGQIVGFAVNGDPSYNSIVKFDFQNNLTGTPTIASLGNIGNLNFPHSISKLFRVNDDVYSFVTNVSNNTITRLRFQGCTNASIASSAVQNPAPVTYNTPGTYNINLTIDDGLPTQTSVCKQVQVLPAPPAVATFTVPDTVCINTPVNITNTSTGASSYYWNFCTGNLNAPPIGSNLGNINNTLVSPVYIDYVQDNGNYYGFVTDNYSGQLFRLDFGASLLNTPALFNFGTLGGAIPTNVEGIQVVKNEGKWYAIIVGGDPVTGATSRILKVEFGASITNSSPIATDWGNIGSLSYPHDLYVFNDNNGNWYGLTVNTSNNTITRFNFTNSFSNTPTAVNLGNIGNLNGPTGLHAINDNGNWYAFVCNALGNTLTRLDFGSSLLNTPTAQNLGNLGGKFFNCWDIYMIKYCGDLLGYVINADQSKNDIVKLNFNNNITSTPTATSFGNIGNLNFPHCLSKIFRVGADLYTFIPNVGNQTLSRLQFAGCTNASIPNSTAQNPPPVTYNTPGTYNINLTLDDGLATQAAFCKQVVVIAPVHQPTQTINICTNDSIKLGTGVKNATYTWNNGATTDSIMVKTSGTWWVQTNRFGCSNRDSFLVNNAPKGDFHYKQDICNPLAVQFYSDGNNLLNPYWEYGDGNTTTGNFNPQYTYPAPGNYTVRFGVESGICKDTITKTIPVNTVFGDVIITPDTTICKNATKQLRTRPALNFCWSPITYLDDPSLPNPVTSTPVDITYYFTAEVTGNNLITNGDFSSGNTGFTSQYSYSNPNQTEGQYFVGTNPHAWNPGLDNCHDHTTGSGNMMLVNGSPVGNVTVWSTTINVTPNTNYAFSTWLQALYTPNPSQLSFSINGKDIGNIITASLPTCTWTRFYNTWNSGSQTTATISIINKNTQIQGNDFALDDISFAPVFIQRDSVIVTVENALVKTNNDTTICHRQPVPLTTSGAQTYFWTPPLGLSNPTIPNPIAKPTATTEYIVTGTTAHGCKAKDTVTISLYARPTVVTSHSELICPNASVQLQAGNALVSWAWSPVTTLDNPAIANPTATPVNNTVYTVQVTDVNNCSYSDSVTVQIRSFHFATSGDQVICRDSSVILNAAGGDTYLWSPAGSLGDAASANPVAAPNTTTQYSVYIAENTCGRDTTIQLKVVVNPVPVVTVQKSNDINCTSPTAKLLASGAISYTWLPIAGLDNPNIPNPVTGIDQTITYTVKGVNEYGCPDIDSIKVIATVEGKETFVVPNAFTPNGDGHNDCFGIRNWGNATVEEFSIFTRWGEKVFTSKGPYQCWDGRYKGKLMEPGGYVYTIKAKTFCGTIKRTGMVMLIR